jgi:hypothetical protein
MSKKNKAPDPFAILDDPPGSWRPVLTLGFCLIGLVLFLAAMAYMIHEVNSGNVVLPGGAGGGN